MYEIYTDGAYSSLRDQIGIGIAYYRDNKLIQEYYNGFKGGTNNIAELLAIYYAMKSVKEAIIYSDSQYAISSVTGKFNGSKNRKLIDAIRSLDGDFTFKYVKGHAQNEGNIVADRLAVQGSHLILCGKKQNI